MTQFEIDVKSGLSQMPKRLFSKYFYDEIGDKLFQDIMNMEEYYLTNSEFEIFTTQKEQILKEISDHGEPFQLVEFGAGDGLKTKVLLRYFIEQNVDFEYVPIDISSNVLEKLVADLEQEIPQLVVRPQENTYFKALDDLSNDVKKVILFLGGNIGNFTVSEAQEFFTKASQKLNQGDRFFIGVDLKKHPKVILDAYNDKSGITRAFNLNLLHRINREMEADFDVSKFDHYPLYDPSSGETKSYLISQVNQSVYLKSVDQKIDFKAGEEIYMEISKKYGIKELENLANVSGFKIQTNLYDCKHYFIDSVWIKK